jgi:hypothetical protein
MQRFDDPFGNANVDALMKARGQSFRELIHDAKLYTTPEAILAFEASRPLALTWQEVCEALADLDPIEKTQRLCVQGLPMKVALLATESATFFVALSFDLVEELNNVAVFVGVHRFEHEPFDLERQNRFAVINHLGRASILPSGELLNALEGGEGAVGLLPVYEVRHGEAGSIPLAKA